MRSGDDWKEGGILKIAPQLAGAQPAHEPDKRDDDDDSEKDS